MYCTFCCKSLILRMATLYVGYSFVNLKFVYDSMRQWITHMILLLLLYICILCYAFLSMPLFSLKIVVLLIWCFWCVSYDIFSVVAFILLSKTIHTIIIESNDWIESQLVPIIIQKVVSNLLSFQINLQ